MKVIATFRYIWNSSSNLRNIEKSSTCTIDSFCLKKIVLVFFSDQSIYYVTALRLFLIDIFVFLGCLAATSFCVSLVISPAVMLFCRNKSTRLTAVVGGLIVSLGILFTSFATSYPHLFFSYGTVIGKAYLSMIYKFSTPYKKPNIFLFISIFKNL